MSRRSRHRPSEPRRNAPPVSPDGPQRVQLAVPEAAPAEPVRIPEAAPVMPMVSLQLPTVTSAVVDEPGGPGGGCTPAQLRRFIKSRAYLPVHEIRRRFGIETADDDVTGFQLEGGRIFVGLPQREGRILGDLVRAGEVGYELQLDPEAPIIVGVYPMRPVTRQ
ncbi:MAG TPA: hypothetical protein VKR24_10435 [Candidatus Limnocylindrales bacterium]|nr:hypothetical protein [Candidatus Limnocylindrales bacterium]